MGAVLFKVDGAIVAQRNGHRRAAGVVYDVDVIDLRDRLPGPSDQTVPTEVPDASGVAFRRDGYDGKIEPGLVVGYKKYVGL
jgi:hypothetical protein